MPLEQLPQEAEVDLCFLFRFRTTVHLPQEMMHPLSDFAVYFMHMHRDCRQLWTYFVFENTASSSSKFRKSAYRMLVLITVRPCQ